MKKALAGVYVSIALLFMLFNVNWNAVIFSLSPQGTVDPVKLTDTGFTNETSGVFNNSIVSIPNYLAQVPVVPKVLGDTTSSKRIEVDLTNQRVYAYDNNQLIYNFLVSTGLWGRTPTGTFRIWTKLRATRMSGGSTALGTYYNLPNVPYTMFFYNDKVSKSAGYSLHGTYWHNNFGHPMSHGCVNMKTEEAALIFAWADIESTPIVIYGTAPTS